MHRVCSGILMVAASFAIAAEVNWTYLSSSRGDLPNPGGSNQQTGMLIANLDGQRAASMVISYRVKAPALVWMRRTKAGWDRLEIEKDFLRLEAGGAAFDIDGDGDQDVVFGQDAGREPVVVVGKPVPELRPEHIMEAPPDQEQRGQSAP